VFEQLKIVHYPHPALRAECLPITPDDLARPDKLAELETLVRRMSELIVQHEGVGLAAPQVGVSIRMFIVNPGCEPGKEKAYINPQFIELLGQAEADEGCLSLPGVTVPVRRATEAVVRAVGLDGQPFEERAEGFLARVWQHESDHINGRLLLDYMSTESRMVNKRAVDELRAAWERAHPKPRKKAPARKRRKPAARRATRR
jgi:peptide deformylase